MADTERGGAGSGAPAAAAFFDLDKTLIEGASGLHFARAAFRAGIVSRRRLALDLIENLRFRLRGSTDETARAVRERVLEAMEGVRAVELARLGPDLLAGLLPSVYPQMLKVAWGHQDAGRPAYIVTAASRELAELLARVLVLDGGIGTPYEVKDGHYTGRLEGPFTYREGKAEALRRMASAEGIDLASSYAYSDSESDLPMLRAVGHPVAVNPDAELREIASAEGWEVMHIDKLGRRLRIASAIAAVGLVGGGGGYLAGRLRPNRRWPAGRGGFASRLRRRSTLLAQTRPVRSRSSGTL